MISKISLGTVQFGLDYGISNFTGKVPLKEAHKMGSLKDAYHELPSALKTQLRDFANDLRAS